MKHDLKRVKALDGIRGLAAIMVFFSHFAVMFYPAFYWSDKDISHCNNIDFFIGQTPFSFLCNGNSGVMIFLMLTGFGSYMIRGGVTKYISLRYLKLLIISIISSCPIYLLYQIGLVRYQQIENILSTPWLIGWNPVDKPYISPLLANPLSSLTAYNGVLWTMPYIFWSSMIAVLLYVMHENCRNRYILYILFAIIFINMGEVYYIPCTLGALFADQYLSLTEKSISSLKGGLICLLGIYLCAYPTGEAPVLFVYAFLPYRFYAYYHIAGAACLIYAALYCSPIKHCMESSFMQFLGKYSMQIYVVHYGILISFSAWMFGSMNDTLSYNITCLAVFIATAVLVMGTALLCAKLIAPIFRLLDMGYDKLLGLQNNK